MRILILLLFSFGLSGEMEIDGDLKVTGSIDAPGLGGMKPERIYQLELVNGDWTSEIVVPVNKLWIITMGTFNTGGVHIKVDGDDGGNIKDNDLLSNFAAFSLQSLEFYTYYKMIVNIYEYSISGSGTSQGMNYVEP